MCSLVFKIKKRLNNIFMEFVWLDANSFENVRMLSFNADLTVLYIIVICFITYFEKYSSVKLEFKYFSEPLVKFSIFAAWIKCF